MKKDVIYFNGSEFVGNYVPVRWALRYNPFFSGNPEWGKWHATWGKEGMTICGLAVRIISDVDRSPEIGDGGSLVTCVRCLRELKKQGILVTE